MSRLQPVREGGMEVEMAWTGSERATGELRREKTRPWRFQAWVKVVTGASSEQ